MFQLFYIHYILFKYINVYYIQCCNILIVCDNKHYTFTIMYIKSLMVFRQSTQNNKFVMYTLLPTWN